MSDRTFSEELLKRLGELDSGPFEELFRAAWMRMATPQGVVEWVPVTESGRALWRQCFSQALAESLEPGFYANKRNLERARIEAFERAAKVYAGSTES